MKPIPYGHQSVSWVDAIAVAKTVKSEWMTMGPALEKFEADLAKVSGGKHVVAVSSGSAALHCAYAAIDLGPGDEIITSPLTFASTATTAMNLGAKVVFADIQPDTGNIDPLHVESLLGPRTKAIVAVDYAGHPADLDELAKISQKHGIVLVEDAAHSLGSIYKDRPVGSVADITTFSFFPTKNIATGEGGAVVTNSKTFARKARLFRSHGLVRDNDSLKYPNEGPWHQEIHSLGLNYRLPDVLASLGSSQLRRIDKFKARRKSIFRGYSEALGGIEYLQLPVERDYVDTMWHLFPIRVPAVKRKTIFEFLRSRGVMVQVNYVPVYWHPYFERLETPRGACARAEAFYLSEISLPMHADLAKSDANRVVRELQAALPKTRSVRIDGENHV